MKKLTNEEFRARVREIVNLEHEAEELRHHDLLGAMKKYIVIACVRCALKLRSRGHGVALA